MGEIQGLWKNILSEKSLIYAVFSNPRNKKTSSYSQVRVRPVLIKNSLYYQLEYQFEEKILHDNLLKEDFIIKLDELAKIMKQINIFTSNNDLQIMISKKMKVKIIKKPASKKQTKALLSHNRKKQYILEDGQVIPFLVELGIMNKNGQVFKNKYSKFRQINRFLELVKDVKDQLPSNRKIRIVDFGCGKSYLTFALHYYLKEICSLDIDIVGLDLKNDVISTCNRLVKKLKLDNIGFLVGDIENYNIDNKVDMVVTLHACNTATDAALAKAVKWQSKIILSVPCCHKELYNQIENDILSPLLSHGIIKERLSALATDSIRALILEILGYDVQLVEFIDMEHTPKNILIRAVKSNNIKNTGNLISNYNNLISFLNANPYLYNLLEEEINQLKE